MRPTRPLADVTSGAAADRRATPCRHAGVSRRAAIAPLEVAAHPGGHRPSPPGAPPARRRRPRPAARRPRAGSVASGATAITPPSRRAAAPRPARGRASASAHHRAGRGAAAVRVAVEADLHQHVDRRRPARARRGRGRATSRPGRRRARRPRTLATERGLVASAAWPTKCHRRPVGHVAALSRGLLVAVLARRRVHPEAGAAGGRPRPGRSW